MNATPSGLDESVLGRGDWEDSAGGASLLTSPTCQAPQLPPQGKKKPNRRTKARRRWRVAIVVVRCVVKLVFVAKRGVFLSAAEVRLLSSVLENYHTRHGPLLGGANVLRHCLRVTGIEDVSQQLAERLFARVAGNFAKPLSRHQFLKICRYVKEYRLAHAVSDAQEAYAAIADRAQQSRRSSAVKDSGTASMDDVTAAVRSFGLPYEAEPTAQEQQLLSRSSRFDSQGSMDRDAADQQQGQRPVPYKDFVDRFFEGDDGTSRMHADAKGLHATTAHKRHAGHTRGGGLPRPTEAKRRAKSVTADTIGGSSVVSGLSSMESIKSRDDEVADDEAAAAAAEANVLPSKKLANRLRATLKDHTGHLRMIRSRAHHAEEAAMDGPQSHIGRWVPRDDGVLQSRFEVQNVRTKPDAQAEGMALRLRLHGTTQPLHHRHPGSVTPQRVSSTRPRPASASAASISASAAAVAFEHLTAPPRPASAVPTANSPQRGKLSPTQAPLASPTKNAATAATTTGTTVHYHPHPHHQPTSHIDIAPAAKRPFSAAPSTRSATYATAFSLDSGATRATRPKAAVVPPQMAEMDTFVRDLAEADEIVHALQRRPDSALAKRGMPRSKVATELFDKLRSKTVDEYANTPSFALPLEFRMRFLDARKHVIPPALLQPQGLLDETKTVAHAALSTMDRWRRGASASPTRGAASVRRGSTMVVVSHTPVQHAAADSETAPPAAPAWSM